MKETTMNTYKNFEKNANIILAITSIGFATSGTLMITHFVTR